METLVGWRVRGSGSENEDKKLQDNNENSNQSECCQTTAFKIGLPLPAHAVISMVVDQRLFFHVSHTILESNVSY